MMVMAFLGETDLVLEPEHLCPVLAKRTVHVVVAIQNLTDPIGKGGDDLWVIIEIPGLHEFNVRMRRRNFVGETIYAVDQNSREQEIGKDDNTLETKLHHMFKTWLDEREGHAGIANLGPAKPHPLPQHPRDLGNVGIGVRVRGAATNDHKTGIRHVDSAGPGIRGGDRGGDPVARRLQHLQVHRQFPSILNGDAMLGGVGVENGRNVIFRVSGGKQHTRHRENMIDALFTKPVQPRLYDRRGEFEIPIFHRPVGEQRRQLFRQHGKFSHGGFRPRPVTADHHTKLPVSHVMHPPSLLLARRP